MSEQQLPEQSSSQPVPTQAVDQEVFNRYNNLETEVLLETKIKLVKELSKNMQLVKNMDFDSSKIVNNLKDFDKLKKVVDGLDMTRSSERAKVVANLEKLVQASQELDVLQQIQTERNKLNKLLDKVNELARTIPVIEKILKSRDF